MVHHELDHKHTVPKINKASFKLLIIIMLCSALRRHRLLLQGISQKLSFSTRKIPWAVLQLETSASKQEIKAHFRKLVKLYHPDLNPCIDPVMSTAKMTEITEAYDRLMDDDYSSRWGDNSVAFACDLYSVEELKSMSLVYDLHAIEILYQPISHDHDDSPTWNVDRNIISKDLQCESRLPIHTDPNDSISDLKRLIQAAKYYEWGFQGRQLDRDKVAKGWELCRENAGEDKACLSSSKPLTVLSYHLFLHSYNIRHGDILYAVIKKM